jgi:hypothetical protein
VEEEPVTGGWQNGICVMRSRFEKVKRPSLAHCRKKLLKRFTLVHTHTVEKNIFKLFRRVALTLDKTLLKFEPCRFSLFETWITFKHWKKKLFYSEPLDSCIQTCFSLMAVGNVLNAKIPIPSSTSFSYANRKESPQLENFAAQTLKFVIFWENRDTQTNIHFK